MKKIVMLFIIISFQVSFSQTDSIQKIENSRHGNLVAYLYELRQIQGEDNIEHTDSTRNYKINIPLWWKIRETPNGDLFGGTFPPVKGIENALLLKSFPKEQFQNLDDFENWVIKDYKTGDTPEWSDSHKILLKKQDGEFSKIGKSYFVQLMRGGRLYHCRYIVIETSKTYLWIDFTATQETYDVNFKKLKELMDGFKII